MASSVQHYFRKSGISAGRTELGVIGGLAALSICTGLMIRHSYETKNIDSSMASSTQHYFRISGIPAGWTEVGVVGALKSLEPTVVHGDQHLGLSLYPACAGLTQTGLLKLENCLEFLEKLKSGQITLELSVESESAIVDIDCHFHDLTPLNTPGNELTAE
jgi:hypothetical protein